LSSESPDGVRGFLEKLHRRPQNSCILWECLDRQWHLHLHQPHLEAFFIGAPSYREICWIAFLALAADQGTLKREYLQGGLEEYSINSTPARRDHLMDVQVIHNVFY